MNDALHAIHIKVSYQGPVSDGSWAVRDDAGLHRPYHDGIVLPATKPAHKQRGAAVLKAYAGGAEVPVYVVVKPAAAAAAGAAGEATAPATARARGAVTTGDYIVGSKGYDMKSPGFISSRNHPAFVARQFACACFCIPDIGV